MNSYLDRNIEFQGRRGQIREMFRSSNKWLVCFLHSNFDFLIDVVIGAERMSDETIVVKVVRRNQFSMQYVAGD